MHLIGKGDEYAATVEARDLMATSIARLFNGGLGGHFLLKGGDRRIGIMGAQFDMR
jgi:hypothetical protein